MRLSPDNSLYRRSGAKSAIKIAVFSNEMTFGLANGMMAHLDLVQVRRIRPLVKVYVTGGKH